jgi:hypothetical protein
MSRREDQPSAHLDRLSFSTYRNLFIGLAMSADLTAACLFGCSGETTGVSRQGASDSGSMATCPQDAGGYPAYPPSGPCSSVGMQCDAVTFCNGGPKPQQWYTCNCGNDTWSCTMTTASLSMCITTDGSDDATSGDAADARPACSQLSHGCTMDSDCCPPYLCIPSAGGSRVCEPDCASLNENACISNAECQPIYGSPTGDLTTVFVFEGCHAAVTGCPAAFMCAYPPGHPESCLLFNGCTPDGWTQDLSCSVAGCPHFYDAGQ